MNWDIIGPPAFRRSGGDVQLRLRSAPVRFPQRRDGFRFSAILFGGYVKMAGEQPGDENANDPRGFLSKPRWQRMIIAFAGPFMNILLAVAVLTGLFMVSPRRFPAIQRP